MKKTASLLALGILFGVEILTPITYAQQADELNTKSESVFTGQVEDEKSVIENEGMDVNGEIKEEMTQKMEDIKEGVDESKVLDDGLSDGDDKVENPQDGGEGDNSEGEKEELIEKGENDIVKLETQTLEDDSNDLGQMNIAKNAGQVRGIYRPLSRTISDGEINENKATELIKIIGWLDEFGAIEKQGPDDGVIKVLSGKLLFEMRELDDLGYFVRLGDDITSADSIGYYLSNEQRQHMTGYNEYSHIVLKFMESSYITFDMNGHGEQQDQIIVLTGQLPKKPRNPSVEGYAFKGWYTTPGCEEGTEYNFDTLLTGDITLYAKRRDGNEGYRIVFDMNGHGEQIKPVYGFLGEFPEVPDIPSADGYVFRGWYATPDCEGGTKYNFDVELTGDMTLYAKWSEFGNGFRVEDNKCVKDSIDGLIKVTNGVDTVYIKDRNQGAEISYGLSPEFYMDYLEKLVAIGDIAQEDVIEEFLLYTNNTLGTLFTGVDGMQSYFYSSQYFRDLYSVGNKYPKSFGTYYYRGNNSGAEYDELDMNFDVTNVNISSELKERGFSGGKIGVAGEGWIDGNNNPCDSTKGEYLPTVEDWKELMEIWADDKGFYVVEEDNGGGEYLLHIVDDSENDMMILFAQDLLIPQSIYLQDDYVGEGQSLWSKQNMDSDIGFYVNQGWMGGIGYGRASDLSNYGNSIAMPVRCFVKLSDSFLVTYDSNNGSEVSKQNVVSGSTITQPDSPTRGGYMFDGWYKDAGLTEKWDFDNDVVTDDVTLYAKWIENKPSGGSSGGGSRGGGSSRSDISKEEDKSVDTLKQDLQNDNSASSGVNIKDSENLNNNLIPTMDSSTSSQNDGKVYSTEFQQAYEFAKGHGITTMPTIQKANMNGNLTRIQMAKMLSQYAINVLGKTPDTSKNNKFRDVSDKKDADYDYAVTLSYQLGIMGQNMPNNKFRPDDEVPRAEFVAAFSRMLYNTSDGEYVETSKYYTHHMEKLKSEGIVTVTDPKMKEHRGYVMIMLMRSAK